MRKISFTVGEKVAVIEDNKITNGVITKIFPEVCPPILVVGFDDGTISKVEIDRVAKIEEANTATEDNENISEERAGKPVTEITITDEEFIDIAGEVISDEIKKIPGGAILGMTLTFFAGVLARRLFTDEENGD